jgi:hypothetical protein
MPVMNIVVVSQPAVMIRRRLRSLKFTGGSHCRWCWSGAMLVMWEGEIGRA